MFPNLNDVLIAAFPSHDAVWEKVVNEYGPEQKADVTEFYGRAEAAASLLTGAYRVRLGEMFRDGNPLARGLCEDLPGGDCLFAALGELLETGARDRCFRLK